MSSLPVSEDTYFSDFSMEILPCSVIRSGEKIGTYNCIPNQETDKYVHIKLSDNPDIAVGDIITFDGESYTVIKIKYDSYEGKNELMKVIY